MFQKVLSSKIQKQVVQSLSMSMLDITSGRAGNCLERQSFELRSRIFFKYYNNLLIQTNSNNSLVKTHVFSS